MCEHDETRLNFPYHALVKHFERNESAALIFNSETDRIFADSLDGRRRFRCPFRGWSPVSNQLDSNGWNLPDFPHHALVKLQSEWHNLSIKVREEKYQPIGSINHESLSLSYPNANFAIKNRSWENFQLRLVKFDEFFISCSCRTFQDDSITRCITRAGPRQNPNNFRALFQRSFRIEKLIENFFQARHRNLTNFSYHALVKNKKITKRK